MLIEILYVPGCPNHEPSLGRIREALQSQSVAVPIHEIEVTDEAMVRVLHFPGSPTIRVNGRMWNRPAALPLVCRVVCTRMEAAYRLR